MNAEFYARRFLVEEPHLVQPEENLAVMSRAILVAIEALEAIQNAYGSPNDEDDITTTAREALAKIRGVKDWK